MRCRGVQRSEILAEFARRPAACLLATDVAARGLDIPDVHWVFQLDAPQNPSNFVHRCGRTARMGRSGNALCLLLPHEDCYVELLAARNVPMSQRAPYSTTADVPALTRRLAEEDRDVMEKATKAFVSHMRGYKEHQCKFIFQLSELDVNLLGRLFGVLRLPVMKEVRRPRADWQLPRHTNCTAVVPVRVTCSKDWQPDRFGSCTRAALKHSSGAVCTTFQTRGYPWTSHVHLSMLQPYKSVSHLRHSKRPFPAYAGNNCWVRATTIQCTQRLARPCEGAVQVRKNRKGLMAFVQSDVDPDTVPYRDPIREKARQRALRKSGPAGPAGATAKAKASGGQKHAREAAAADDRKAQEKKLPSAKRQQKQQREDAGDLMDDYRMYRRHKKGKVADAEYERSIGLVD